MIEFSSPLQLAYSRPKYQSIRICYDVLVVVDIVSSALFSIQRQYKMLTKIFRKFAIVHMIILNLTMLWTTITIRHLSLITRFDAKPLTAEVDLANSSAIDVCPS